MHEKNLFHLYCEDPILDISSGASLILVYIVCHSNKHPFNQSVSTKIRDQCLTNFHMYRKLNF